ncbi:hypothetical protein EGI22_15025, partial [Lacihabitans sp. LS3-19]
MKTIFTLSIINIKLKSLLSFFVVLLISINTFAQVTATEDFETETNNGSFVESSINFTHTFSLTTLAPYGYGGSSKFLELITNSPATSNSANIAINNSLNPGACYKINSFAAYVSNSSGGAIPMNGSITVSGIPCGQVNTLMANITINSNGGALGSGQTIDANGIVNGLNFIGTPLDGLYFQSLTFNTVDGDGLGGGNGLVYLEIDHVNFTTTVPVTNTYAIANANFSEGNAGTTVNTYTITRSLGTLAGSVQIQSSNGTATAGSDYVAVPLTTVNFPIGSLSQTVNVTINGDVTLEPNETINMTLSNPTGGTISSGSAIITILNDDSFIETFEDETNLANTFTEGGVNFQSTGKLGISKTVSAIGSGSSFGFLDSKAPYATGNQGSIEVTTAGKTFKMLSVDLWSSLNSGNSFPATACTVTFTGLKEDGINTVSHSASISPTGLNGFETVNFTGTPFDNIPLISISFSVSGSVNYLAIDNFNFAPSNITTTQLSINDVSLLEGTLGGNTSAVFTVSRSNNSTAFSVNVTSSNLTASAGS